MAETDNDRPLTPRQQRFCELFIQCDSATEACLKAGYSEKGADRQASRLLRNVGVMAEITRRREAASKRAEIDEDAVLKMLLEDREAARAAKQYGPAVRAAELLGRKMGMFIDKRIVGEIREHTDEEVAAGLAKATAGGDPALARTLYRNARAKIGSDTFDPIPVLSDDEIDALLDAA